MILSRFWKCYRNINHWILCLAHGRARILYSDSKFANMLLELGAITDTDVIGIFLQPEEI